MRFFEDAPEPELAAETKSWAQLFTGWLKKLDIPQDFIHTPGGLLTGGVPYMYSKRYENKFDLYQARAKFDGTSDHVALQAVFAAAVKASRLPSAGGHGGAEIHFNHPFATSAGALLQINNATPTDIYGEILIKGSGDAAPIDLIGSTAFNFLTIGNGPISPNAHLVRNGATPWKAGTNVFRIKLPDPAAAPGTPGGLSTAYPFIEGALIQVQNLNISMAGPFNAAIAEPNKIRKITWISGGPTTNLSVAEITTEDQLGFDLEGNWLGTYDAATNTPAISSGSGDVGDYYQVTVAGTIAADGIGAVLAGSWIYRDRNGTWRRMAGQGYFCQRIVGPQKIFAQDLTMDGGLGIGLKRGILANGLDEGHFSNITTRNMLGSGQFIGVYDPRDPAIPANLGQGFTLYEPLTDVVTSLTLVTGGWSLGSPPNHGDWVILGAGGDFPSTMSAVIETYDPLANGDMLWFDATQGKWLRYNATNSAQDYIGCFRTSWSNLRSVGDPSPPSFSWCTGTIDGIIGDKFIGPGMGVNTSGKLPINNARLNNTRQDTRTFKISSCGPGVMLSNSVAFGGSTGITMSDGTSGCSTDNFIGVGCTMTVWNDGRGSWGNVFKGKSYGALAADVYAGDAGRMDRGMLIEMEDYDGDGKFWLSENSLGHTDTLILRKKVRIAITGNVNDLNHHNARHLEIDSSGVFDITGLDIPDVYTVGTYAAGAVITSANTWEGFEIDISNRGANNFVLKHENAGSAVNHRFNFYTGADVTVIPGQIIPLKFFLGKFRLRSL